MSVLLCVDIGTSSLKAALVSDLGRVAAFSRISFKLKNHDTTYIARLWVQALKEAVEDLKQQVCKTNSNGLSDCRAIVISGNGPTLVTDDGLTLLWNALEDTNPPQLPQSSQGSLFMPRFALFREHFNTEFNNASTIFSGPEYLIWRLCGAKITILPESRYSRAYWSEQVLVDAGIDPDKVPPFVGPGHIAGKFSCSDNDINLPEGIPVIAGGPDFTVAMIGTNTLSPGKLCDCAGSSEGINLCTDRPLTKNNIRTLPSVIPGLWNAAFMLSQSGKKFAHTRKAYMDQTGQECDYKEYIDYCFENKESDGYKTMTELAGKIKNGLNEILLLAKENNVPVYDYMMVTGGQAKNQKWMNLKQDILEYKLCVTESPDSELIGDAVLGFYGLGDFDSIQQAADKLVHIKDSL